MHEPETAPTLAAALATADVVDRPAIVAALVRMGAAGAGEAQRVYQDATQPVDARVAATTVLGEHALAQPDSAATHALIDGAGRGEPLVRAVTQTALGRVAAAHELVAGALVQALGESDISHAERVGDLARALASGAQKNDVRAAAAARLTAVWQATPWDAFALRVRLLRAMGELGDPALAPLVAAATHDADPILRRVAVSAGSRLSYPDVDAAAARADDDAGVRRAALIALTNSLPPASETAFVHALVADPWPIVRRAAADGLGAGCAQKRWLTPPALVRAVVGEGNRRNHLASADPSEEVRRAALAALDHCTDLPTALAQAVLRERHQPLALRELAARMVAKQGGPAAARVLADTLEDVLADASADERSAALAVICARALARTGDTGRPVLQALGTAANEPLSPAVRAAALDTIGELCPTGARVALLKGLQDSDAAVARAARAAQQRCPR
jgi:hypothetical protein